MEDVKLKNLKLSLSISKQTRARKPTRSNCLISRFCRQNRVILLCRHEPAANLDIPTPAGILLVPAFEPAPMVIERLRLQLLRISPKVEHGIMRGHESGVYQVAEVSFGPVKARLRGTNVEPG